jgi:Delta7-sterol 5-desaturase
VLNSVTHHALHHEKFTANIGLNFDVWDRMRGTKHRDYEHRFAQAVAVPSHPPLVAKETTMLDVAVGS